MRGLTRTISAIAGFLMMTLATMVAPSLALADSAAGTIEVTASDPCVVSLVGTSDNTVGYDEQLRVDDKATFSVTADEPGDYEYEMKQVSAQGLEVYDETTYHIWVTAYYENDSAGGMQISVTGGIVGTDDKPESFKFEKPKPEPKAEEPQKQEPQTLGNIIQMGDETVLVMLSIIMASITLLVLTGTFKTKGGRR